MKNTFSHLSKISMLQVSGILMTVSSGAVSTLGYFEMYGSAIASITIGQELGKVALNRYLSVNKGLSHAESLGLNGLLYLLMAMSSFGIFCNLLTAHQGKEGTTSTISADIDAQNKRMEFARQSIASIEAQIAAVPASSPTGKSRLVAALAPSLREANSILEDASKRISDLRKASVLALGEDTVGIVARNLGLNPSMLNLVLITGFVLVFDPLAVALISCGAKEGAVTTTVSHLRVEIPAEIVAPKAKVAKVAKVKAPVMEVPEVQVPATVVTPEVSKVAKVKTPKAPKAKVVKIKAVIPEAPKTVQIAETLPLPELIGVEVPDMYVIETLKAREERKAARKLARQAARQAAKIS
jgi:hypothetical protein